MVVSTLKLQIFIDPEQNMIDRFRQLDMEDGVAFSVTAAEKELPEKEEGKTNVLISGNKELIEKAERLGYRIVCLGDAEELEKIAEKAVEKITEIDEEAGEELPRILWPKEEGEDARVLRFRNLLFLLKAEHDAEMFEAEVQRISTTDALTGLHNRWYFEEFLKNNPDKVWTLLYIDLDGFKSVNDSLGHTRGDRVLVQVAEILKGIFPQAEHIRLGGDEFTVYVKNDTDRVTMAEYAGKIISGLSDKEYIGHIINGHNQSNDTRRDSERANHLPCISVFQQVLSVFHFQSSLNSAIRLDPSGVIW